VNRENLVGTIQRFQVVGHAKDDTASEWQETLLVEFLGEGVRGVVFGTGSPADGSRSGLCVKFYKPQPWLEMEMLHHSFRVHERLFPDHPLRMSPEERLRRMTAEMIVRIDSGRLIYRVRTYKKLFETTLIVLATQFHDKFKEGTLTATVLWEDATTRLFIDDNLLDQVQDLLDEDRTGDEYRDFFGVIAGLLPAAIGQMKQRGVYRPIATNPIASLGGLYLEDFINYEETMHIASSASFKERLQASHLWDSLQFAAIFYARASAMADAATEEGDKVNVRNRARFEQIRVAMALYKLTRHCSLGLGDDGPRLAAISDALEARILILQNGASSEALEKLAGTLDELERTNAIPEKCGVLVDLAQLYGDSDANRASHYRAEAERIKEKLQCADRPKSE
jgi:hypothetical protein